MCDRLQRADLIDDVGEQILGRDVDEAPAESGQVAVAHLCSDAHPGLGGQSAYPHQAGWIARVEPAGHVGAGDDSEHGVVIAKPPDAEALAQVGVDVDTGHLHSLEGLVGFARSSSRRFAARIVAGRTQPGIRAST